MLLDQILRLSPTLTQPLAGVERAAATDSPILILGEPGTGRTTLARALHLAGDRGPQPLIEIDPGTLPTSLFESELFGYQAGAFTGAETAEPGRVARAEGGTLVLDHVEELPLAVQPTLLRLLAEKCFAPLGGKERRADVRFIAIGPEDLGERIRRGAFRQDLFYRLEVLAFRLPPLRQRARDLPAICEHFLDDLCRRFERPPVGLGEKALHWMQRYSWPGNLRQVRNVLERALILSPAGELDPEPPSDAAEPRPRTLAEVERAEILRALAYTRGHQGKAAEVLGISRKALWEKRRRFGIP
ncbi:MAG: sigma-54 dependent transcriptional regulator [Thermoanaerobaculia bacterium]